MVSYISSSFKRSKISSWPPESVIHMYLSIDWQITYPHFSAQTASEGFLSGSASEDPWSQTVAESHHWVAEGRHWIVEGRHRVLPPKPCWCRRQLSQLEKNSFFKFGLGHNVKILKLTNPKLNYGSSRKSAAELCQLEMFTTILYARVCCSRFSP